MSNIGVFAIIINDGKQDAMLQATDFLRNRLVMIRMERQKNPKIKDATPTLRDVEETHILFINAHFRPFVTFAYEYHKTSLNGTVNFGSQNITFSIEQYGEFFHDMVVNVVVGPTDVGTTGMYVAWADNLGHKLLEVVRFRVNGTELDYYTHESANFFNKFMVTPNKRYGYNTLIGQENPLEVRVANSGFTGAAGSTGALTDQYNRLDTIVQGLQTPKPTHPEFELWIPLQFWFNQDVRISFPSIAVPYGQRFIEMNLAPSSSCCTQWVVVILLCRLLLLPMRLTVRSSLPLPARRLTGLSSLTLSRCLSTPITYSYTRIFMRSTSSA